jgi:hypothetical protein
MPKLLKYTLFAGAILGAATLQTHAAIDASVTNIVSDASTFFASVLPVKGAIVVAGIAFSLVKFLKGR